MFNKSSARSTIYYVMCSLFFPKEYTTFEFLITTSLPFILKHWNSHDRKHCVALDWSETTVLSETFYVFCSE